MSHVHPTYHIDPKDTVLLIVDPQLAFGQAVPVPDVEVALRQMRRAASGWRRKNGAVMLTQHLFSSLDEVGRVADFIPGIGQVLIKGSPLADFHPNIVEPSDELVHKARFDATRGTTWGGNLLVHILRERRQKTVVVCGLTTPICVAGTAEGLMAADFQVILLEDACASQAVGSLTAIEAHRAAVERMRYIIAEVISTDEFLCRLEQ